MVDVIIRRAERNDDFFQMAQCLYLTDPFIYPGAFGDDPIKAAEAIAILISKEEGLLGYPNYILALQEDRVCGLLLVNDGSAGWDSEGNLAMIAHLVEDEDKFRFTAEHYFRAVAALTDQQTEVVACCVMPQYRRQGIAEKMLKWLIQNDPESTFALDVLADNPAAVCLYQRCGFEIIEKYKGFSLTEETRPDCYRMKNHI